MDTVGGPDAKKARWSPTSFTNGSNGLPNGPASATRDVFANYGYGPQANISHSPFNGSPPSATFGANPLYTTSLGASANGNGMAPQMSPNTATAFAAQQQQHQQQQQQQQAAAVAAQQAAVNGNGAYAGFNGYNMLGMGLPGMGVLGVGGFPYNNQMSNFSQVSPEDYSFTLSVIANAFGPRRALINSACRR